MTKQEKEEIRRLRAQGISYSKVTSLMGISENTVKSFCRRNHLGGQASGIAAENGVDHCRQCGTPLEQTVGKKQKRYCSDKCRMVWWNAHPEAVNRKSIKPFTCQSCGRAFEGYGKRERIYCSRACYGKSKTVRG